MATMNRNEMESREAEQRRAIDEKWNYVTLCLVIVIGLLVLYLLEKEFPMLTDRDVHEKVEQVMSLEISNEAKSEKLDELIFDVWNNHERGMAAQEAIDEIMDAATILLTGGDA